MQYIQLIIILNPDYQEIFIAELADTEFEGFRQEGSELTTYIVKEQLTLEDREHIEHLLAAYPGQNYIKSEEIVAQQNWNRQWEQTIQPQVIGKFLVKPTWSDAIKDNDQLLLEIDPKMAFGTGYHPTTKLMLQQMPEYVDKGSTVLDAGTGSGILAIAAAKLGAKTVLAFDKDEWCVRNARENVYLNEVSKQITVKKGDQHTIGEGEMFDVILVNITLGVIGDMTPTLMKHLNDDGIILYTGLLEKNLDEINNLLNSNGLNRVHTENEDDWVLVSAVK